METLRAVRVKNSPHFILKRINGKTVALLTMNALSKYIGYKAHTIRQWERKGIIPRTEFTEIFDSGLGMECERRLYTYEQANVLKSWVEQVKPNHGVKIAEWMIKRLHDKWREVTKASIERINSNDGEEWYRNDQNGGIGRG